MPEADDDLPHHKHLLVIMDAKYGGNAEGTTCQDGQYKDFAWMVEKLACRKDTWSELHLGRFSGIIKNCIITNGNPFTEDVETLESDSIQIVKGFAVDSDDFEVIG